MQNTVAEQQSLDNTWMKSITNQMIRVPESDAAQNQEVNMLRQEVVKMNTAIAKLANNSAVACTKNGELKVMMSEMVQSQQHNLAQTGRNPEISSPTNLTIITQNASQPNNPAPPPQGPGII